MEKALYKKLLNIQQEIKSIKKEQTNPFFHSKYFDINTILMEVKPILNKYGLVLTQPIRIGEGKNVLYSIITDGEEESYISSSMILPDIQDPQKLGSAITYFRRYTLQSLLALEAEDDDGNKASLSTQKYSRSAPPPIKTVVIEKDPKKQIISLLVKLDRIDPDIATKEAYETAVKHATDLKLEEKNYPEIISRLEVLAQGL